MTHTPLTIAPDRAGLSHTDMPGAFGTGALPDSHPTEAKNLAALHSAQLQSADLGAQPQSLLSLFKV